MTGSPATSTRLTSAASAPTTEISVARLDRLIQVMHEQRAEGLQLAVGKPASLVANGGVRPVTKEALTDAQILGLLREIAGETARGRPAPVRFPTGHRPARSGSSSAPDPEGPAPWSARPRPAPLGSGARRRPPRAGRIWPRPARPWRRCSALLVDSGASDLHLRSGEPPLLRRDGELVREEQPAIPAERLEHDAARHHDARGVRRISGRRATPTGRTRSKGWPASAATPAATGTGRWRSSGSSPRRCAPPTRWG